MQAGHGKEVKCSCLLKRFLDVFRGLVTKTQRQAADEVLHIWRPIEPPAKHSLNSGPGMLCRAQNTIAAIPTDDCPILRITNGEMSVNVMSGQVRSHVELTGIARRIDRRGNAEERQLISELGDAAPADENCRVG